MVKVSVTISGFSRHFADLRGVLDVARIADDAGIDQLVVADHVVMGSRLDRYPFGEFPYPAEEPWPEPLTLLTAMAAVTTRVRLATGILISPLRPAALLAKQVATIDQLSGGRVDLGLGVGWQREEYDAVGLDYRRRWQHFDDQLVALRALWTEAPPVSLETETVRFGPTWCEPRPVAAGGVPLGFGMAATDANVERIAEHGAAWLPIHTTSDEALTDGLARIRASMARRGRDPSLLDVRSAGRPVLDAAGRLDPGATRDEAAARADLGVTTVAYGLGRNLTDGDDVERFLVELGRAFA